MDRYKRRALSRRKCVDYQRARTLTEPSFLQPAAADKRILRHWHHCRSSRWSGNGQMFQLRRRVTFAARWCHRSSSSRGSVCRREGGVWTCQRPDAGFSVVWLWPHDDDPLWFWPRHRLRAQGPCCQVHPAPKLQRPNMLDDPVLADAVNVPITEHADPLGPFPNREPQPRREPRPLCRSKVGQINIKHAACASVLVNVTGVFAQGGTPGASFCDSSAGVGVLVSSAGTSRTRSPVEATVRCNT
jgi:hypothetical protein